MPNRPDPEMEQMLIRADCQALCDTIRRKVYDVHDTKQLQSIQRTLVRLIQKMEEPNND